MIFRKYCLHGLFTLSIYHPARGFDLFANNVASVERQELLAPARATLKSQNNDKGIWSNWDLVVSVPLLLRNQILTAQRLPGQRCSFCKALGEVLGKQMVSLCVTCQRYSHLTVLHRLPLDPSPLEHATKHAPA